MSKTTTQTLGVTVANQDLILSWAGLTDKGRRRETNQDAYLAEYPLFVVADGMGGHAGGEVASQATISQLHEMLTAGEPTPQTIQTALENAVAEMSKHPDTTDDGTGTTLTGVFLESDGDAARVVALNIGDSRVYRLRDAQLVQITTDHSVVQDLIDAGKISAEEAEGHPYSNVITRAVGASELLPPDYFSLDIKDGDRFVICSDGLTKELTDYGIQHFLKEHADPSPAADAMLAAALENGGRDNVTIIVLQVASNDSASTKEPAGK